MAPLLRVDELRGAMPRTTDALPAHAGERDTGTTLPHLPPPASTAPPGVVRQPGRKAGARGRCAVFCSGQQRFRAVLLNTFPPFSGAGGAPAVLLFSILRRWRSCGCCCRRQHANVRGGLGRRGRLKTRYSLAGATPYLRPASLPLPHASFHRRHLLPPALLSRYTCVPFLALSSSRAAWHCVLPATGLLYPT